MTARFTSPATLLIPAACRGDICLSSQRRIFGASRSSSRTRTKIVKSSMTRDTAPLPTARAGLDSVWA